MNKFQLLLLSGLLLILTGCASSGESGDAEEANADLQKLKELMYEPEEVKLNDIMKKAAEKEDWLGAVPKIEELITKGLANGDFAEDSILCEEMSKNEFHCLLIARKYDEAMKFAERLPFVQKEIKAGKNYRSESNTVILEAGTIGKYCSWKKATAKLDAYLKKSDITKEDRQKVMYFKALASSESDPKKCIKLLKETKAVDPESKISELINSQIEAMERK